MSDRGKVMVAMSGGVDSSAAAVLLMDQGYEVCGATLKLFTNGDIGIDDRTRTCCSLTDVLDARSVADKLGFDHHVFNFNRHFINDVVTSFINEYLAGRTPNPCINCNKFVKFGKLIDRALLMGYNFIATGHYARVEYNDLTGRYELKRARDLSKDQSYVLFAMTQRELKHTLFPLGDYTKSEVRDIAQDRNLINARKPDSQDICFVPDGDYAKFIEESIGTPSTPGNFVDRDNRVIGVHKGIIHYTIGQRRGIGISSDAPLYVVNKDKARNTVTLGRSEDLFADTLTVSELNWISIAKLGAPMRVTVKIRYGTTETPATIEALENGDVYVKLDRPLRAISPGQAAVFYSGDIVVGGGTII